MYFVCSAIPGHCLLHQSSVCVCVCQTGMFGHRNPLVANWEYLACACGLIRRGAPRTVTGVQTLLNTL